MNTIMWSRVRSALFSLLIIACAVVTPLSHAEASAFPGVNGKIVFEADSSIYTINPDGSAQTALRLGALPSWSADGLKIIYRYYFNGSGQIYTMNPDGSGVTQIGSDTAYSSAPSFSPDGSKVVFVSNRFGDDELFVMNIDGTNLTQITNNTVQDELPTWSPDGTKIAFTSESNPGWEIYTINPDGSGLTNITNHASQDIAPSWSPDGSKIAFVSARDGNDEIYIVNPDGTNPVRITNNPASDTWPAWSPDASKIAFSSNRDGNYEIYVMNTDGTNQTRVTNDPLADTHPNWQPVTTGTITATMTNEGGGGIFRYVGTGGIGNIQISTAVPNSVPTILNNRPAGTYSIAYTWLPGQGLTEGFVETANTCQNILVTPGQNTTCAITVSKVGSLALTVQTVNGDDTFGFTTTDPQTPSFDLTTTAGMATRTLANLTPGTYSISAANVPTGWTMTDTTCSNVAIATGQDATCTMTFTKEIPHTGVISGKAFRDINGNGMREVGEGGQAGWTVTLSGPVSSTTVTTTGGNYSFTGLPAGHYTINETQQSGWVRTNPHMPIPIDLTEGQVLNNIDIGNFKLGIISGIAFHDNNRNGVRDAGEEKLAGWTVTASWVGRGSTMSTTTDATGKYTFPFAFSGQYSITQTVQPGWEQTTADPAIVTVTSGTVSNNNNFGNDPTTGTISGRVFRDRNADGLRDLSESGLANWTVTLTGPTGSTTVTATGGLFSFTNLAPGTYTLTETLQTGWLQTTTIAPIVIAPGDEVTQNIGNFELGSISGIVYRDTNRNGVRDIGEPKLPGWTVVLHRPDTTTTLVATDITGKYTFTGLTTGEYTVTEMVPTGWVQTSSDPLPITMVSGLDSTGNNFGNNVQ